GSAGAAAPRPGRLQPRARPAVPAALGSRGRDRGARRAAGPHPRADQPHHRRPAGRPGASSMTTETSNARGEVVAWQYRRLDPEDGIGPWIGCSESDAEIIQSNPLFEVRPLYATPPAAARGDVRGLVAKLMKVAG